MNRLSHPALNALIIVSVLNAAGCRAGLGEGPTSPSSNAPRLFLFTTTGESTVSITGYRVNANGTIRRTQQPPISSNEIGRRLTVTPASGVLLASGYRASAFSVREDGSLKLGTQITSYNDSAIVTDPGGRFAYLPRLNPDHTF